MPKPDNQNDGYTKSSKEVYEAEKDIIGPNPTIGLAISGGGIRSASFALGVLQALVKNKLLDRIDYLSTVSGGGYIGMALLWWLKRGLPKKNPNGTVSYSVAGTSTKDFPFGVPGVGTTQSRDSESQNAILNYLRFHSSYLVPTRRIDFFSIVGIFLRNSFLSIAMHVCVVILLMFIFFALMVGAYRILDGAIFNDSVIASAHKYIPLKDIRDNFIVDYILAGFFSHILIACLSLFVIISIGYSLGTLIFQILQKKAGTPEKTKRFATMRYRTRTNVQIVFGYLFKLALIAIIFRSLPFANSIDMKWPWVLGMSLVALILMFVPFYENIFRRHGFFDRTRRTIGAGLFLYVIIAISYFLVSPVLNAPLQFSSHMPSINGFSLKLDISLQELAAIYLIVAIILVLFVIAGWFVNVNYLGIHRMYRDRLMELFLPDSKTVLEQTWSDAVAANTTVIEDLCSKGKRRPYPLINTNVVLIDSPTTKYRERGGTNFVISPLYCGSDATGWRQSKKYMKRSDPGMTLPTAIAISGAAASPYAGAGGTAWTRNRVVSIVMAILSLRLGYWAPNPKPGKPWNEIPNFLFPGITESFLFRRLHENNRVLDLTDGGHFENLGLYELARRRLETIIVCDGSADSQSRFGALALAIERIKVDFGATIKFEEKSDDVNKSAGKNSAPMRFQKQVAKKGFVIGDITYKCGKTGTIIYIKPTLISKEGLIN